MITRNTTAAEVAKSHRSRTDAGFYARYLSGAVVLDVGFRGNPPTNMPVVSHAIGIDLDYPGYDGTTLPFAAESVDCVFSSHCLEHVDFPRSILSDWFRVVKVGGFIVCIVPHKFLYEKRHKLPSRWNADHRQFFTPASLLLLVEGILMPNSYRVRRCADNDDGFDYSIGPDRHSGGCYEIELVLQKIPLPQWAIV